VGYLIVVLVWRPLPCGLDLGYLTVALVWRPLTCGLAWPLIAVGTFKQVPYDFTMSRACYALCYRRME